MTETRTQHHYRKWKGQVPLGLGASLLGYATNLKAKDTPNAGLSLFGDAVKHRALYEASGAVTDA